jgi:hypothetical protein
MTETVLVELGLELCARGDHRQHGGGKCLGRDREDLLVRHVADDELGKVAAVLVELVVEDLQRVAAASVGVRDVQRLDHDVEVVG